MASLHPYVGSVERTTLSLFIHGDFPPPARAGLFEDVTTISGEASGRHPSDFDQALMMAGGEWIVQLRGGETMDHDALVRLAESLDALPTSTLGVKVRHVTLSNDDGQPGWRPVSWASAALGPATGYVISTHASVLRNSPLLLRETSLMADGRRVAPPKLSLSHSDLFAVDQGLVDPNIQARRHQWAIASLERRLDAEKYDVEAWLNLGHALSESGRSESATRAFERGLDLCPGHPGHWRGLVHGLVASGKYGRATYEIERRLRLVPYCPSSYDFLARIALAQGDLEEAGSNAARAVAFDETDDFRVLQLAMVQLVRERNEAALGLLGPVCDGQSPPILADLMRAAALEATGNPDEALDALIPDVRGIPPMPATYEVLRRVGEAHFSGPTLERAMDLIARDERRRGTQCCDLSLAA